MEILGNPVFWGIVALVVLYVIYTLFKKLVKTTVVVMVVLAVVYYFLPSVWEKAADVISTAL